MIVPDLLILSLGLTCMIFHLLMFDTISEHAELGHALMAQVVFSSMRNPEYEN